MTSIDLANRMLETSTGDVFEWDVLLSSIPLKTLCASTDDDDLRRAASRLSHSSTVSFNIGIRGPLKPQFQDVHWVYVPDRSIPFYRIGFYSNISRGTCAADCSSMYVEVGVPFGQLKNLALTKLQSRVIECLERLGWLDSRDIVCVMTHILEHAYVHHTPDREAEMEPIQDRLHESNVFTFGRYGKWDYTSMEDSMESARQTVMAVL
jgi:protoporphyrinogen oxidase